MKLLRKRKDFGHIEVFMTVALRKDKTFDVVSTFYFYDDLVTSFQLTKADLKTAKEWITENLRKAEFINMEFEGYLADMESFLDQVFKQ